MSARRVLLGILVGLGGALGLVGQPVHAQETCQPGLAEEYAQNRPTYDLLIRLLAGPVIPEPIPAPVNWVERARSLAAQVPGGRAVLALQDGTVVYDSRQDPASPLISLRRIENLNRERIAAFQAQKYPCGTALQRRYAPASSSYESAVALRIGGHLDSELTLLLSTNSF